MKLKINRGWGFTLIPYTTIISQYKNNKIDFHVLTKKSYCTFIIKYTQILQSVFRSASIKERTVDLSIDK
jgi:hypothetical protein